MSAPAGPDAPLGPADRQTVPVLASALMRLHNSRLIHPSAMGMDASERLAGVSWCYTSVLTNGRWLRRQVLHDERDARGICFRASQSLVVDVAEHAITRALRNHRVDLWVPVFCGPDHGWWEFAPHLRGLTFAGVTGRTATWDHPHGRSSAVLVQLDGRVLLTPWLVEDDVARPLEHLPEHLFDIGPGRP